MINVYRKISTVKIITMYNAMSTVENMLIIFQIKH